MTEVAAGDGLDSHDQALLALGRVILQSHYQFITPTPLTHQRILARAVAPSMSLRDIFGWNRAFAPDAIDPALRQLMVDAGVHLTDNGMARSAVRFSTLGWQLFIHSGYPTVQEDAVFFGPDTYRFANATRQVVAELPDDHVRILDIGAGSGAGGLYAASLLRDRASRIVLTDINARALRYSRINAQLNRVGHAETVHSDLYAQVQGPFDLIVSNPPYLVDPLQRTYRHGGGTFGSDLSLRIALEGLPHLAPHGRLLVYTGSAIVEGRDLFEQTLQARLPRGIRLSYREIDPDVFGEELEAPPYDRADRIAAVAAVLSRD